jgi:hypothetical protein
MAIDATDAGKLNNAGVVEQDVQLGTELKSIQDRVTALEALVTGLQTGVGITLPTSEPATAGSLWSDSLIVTVSDGA